MFACKMITNIIFARKTWCPEYTNNLGLEVDSNKYKYLAINGEKREMAEGERMSLSSLLYGSEEIRLTIEYFSL